MDKIRSLIVVSTITIILLLVIAEQATSFSFDNADCYGRCTPNCEQTCKLYGYTGWFCQGKVACCCTPKKKIFGQSVQLIS
ncbi:hypothetical protein N665_4492s0001 [Sinapis alba]|nr:hypothetical protein N665_4492s0001 [Sinapis alba]